MALSIRKSLLLISSLILAVGLGSAQAAVVQFNVLLSGSAEFPGPGDTDGSGLAILRIDSVANTINWNITTNNIDLPIAGAHIHQGEEGGTGPIVSISMANSAALTYMMRILPASWPIHLGFM